MMIKHQCVIGSLFFLFAISCSEDEANDPGDDQQAEACFEVADDGIKVGDELKFVNCSQNASRFVWDFGDGTSSTQKDPSHTYSQQGEYEIQLLAGEDENNDGTLDNPDSVLKTVTIAPNRISIEITIKDATTWTLENPGLSIVVGADAKLYAGQSSIDADTPDIIVKSDENGKATFYDLENGDYYLSVEMGDLKSSKAGFLIAGVFQSQEDIDNSPFQEDAAIGEIKYLDANGDGIISDDDMAQFRFITIPSDEPFTREVVIGK